MHELVSDMEIKENYVVQPGKNVHNSEENFTKVMPGIIMLKSGTPNPEIDRERES